MRPETVVGPVGDVKPEAEDDVQMSLVAPGVEEEPVFSDPLFLSGEDLNFNCLEPTYGCSGDCSCDGD